MVYWMYWTVAWYIVYLILVMLILAIRFGDGRPRVSCRTQKEGSKRLTTGKAKGNTTRNEQKGRSLFSAQKLTFDYTDSLFTLVISTSLLAILVVLNNFVVSFTYISLAHSRWFLWLCLEVSGPLISGDYERSYFSPNIKPCNSTKAAG